MTAGDSQTRVRVATAREQRDALGLALRSLAPEARATLVESVTATPSQPLGPLDGLLVATWRGSVVAATWAQPTPGRAAAIWPPEWDGPRPEDATAVETNLLAKAVAICDACGVPICQLLFESEDDPRIAAATHNDFRRIAVLDYLGRVIRDTPSEAETSDLAFDPIGPDDYERLKRVISATYIDSQDCPGLESQRDLDDVLAGYRATGRYDPANWMIARDAERDAGVLIVTEHPGAQQMELIYMGVVPEARGRRYGDALVARAIRAGVSCGADQLMVAVDRANLPATRVYERAGFAAWASRAVLVRP